MIEINELNRRRRRISWLFHTAIDLVHNEDRPLQFGHCPSHQLVIDVPNLLLGQVLLHKAVLFDLQDKLRLSLFLSG